MVSFRDITSAIKNLGLRAETQVIAHASLSAFGEVRGGADTLLGALLASVKGVMMPAFTYKTMLTPEDGPAQNAITYGSGRDGNLMAEFFRPEMPADPSMGVVAETLRRLPNARRSMHPILSFSGINSAELLQAQSLEYPLAPIAALLQKDGWVLLLGVNHTANTSLHLAEKLAGRKQFVRWALTREGVRECPDWPGCSDGFESAAAWFGAITRQVQVGSASVRALPLRLMVQTAIDHIHQDPMALLCSRLGCERCDAVRQALADQEGSHASR